MKEQAIVHKVGNRSGISGQRRSGVNAQKPQRRESRGEGIGSRIRSVFSYFPSMVKIVVAAVVGVVIFASYRAAASATFFNVRSVEVQGNARVAKDDVQAIVRQHAEKSGVWNADLPAITARLERLAWVRTAVVSRVLPDSLRVRISERIPRVVVRTAAGRFRWVDEEAVMLGEMLPTDQIPSFFLRGLSEEDSDTARYENRIRVQKFLELQQAWDAAGLSERVSEVNLMDIRDVRAQLAGDSSQIEVRLGSQDQSTRLRDALNVLDGQRQTPRGALISYIDMSPGKRAIVGLSSGASTSSDDSTVSSTTSEGAKEKKIAPASTDSPTANRVASDARTVDPTKKKDDRDKRTNEKKADKDKETARRRT